MITKPIEDEINTISGVKQVTSKSLEGVSMVNAEFQMDVDSRFIEQKVRDKINKIKARLPKDINDPDIVKMDPSYQPIMQLVVSGELNDGQLYDIAEQTIKPMLEQINNVGSVKIKGGRKREIQVVLDRNLLKNRDLSVMQVANKLSETGENIPGGTVSKGDRETNFRSLGEFKNPVEINQAIITQYGNELSTRVSDIGKVIDTLEDETSRVFINGKKALIIEIYRQSGTNTVAVADKIKSKIDLLQKTLSTIPGNPKISILQDSSIEVKADVKDVEETILLGILLTIVVVYFFLGNGRSTLITGLALPTSLIGSFIFMKVANFSLNMVSLMALSLAIGLLIDDAIVVRENIFRKIEGGMKAKLASIVGTKEVQLAVIATSLVVLSVFAPVGMMSGIIGKVLNQFGLTICFAMVISLLDSLTVAPMLSTYLAVKPTDRNKPSIWNQTIGRLLIGFESFQDWLTLKYESVLRVTTRHHLSTIGISILIFIICCSFIVKVPFNFMPESDNGECLVSLELKSGTNLNAMNDVAKKADHIIHQNSLVDLTQMMVGGSNNEANKASIYIKLKTKRSITTTDFKAQLREQLKVLNHANPIVSNYGTGGPQGQPLAINLSSNNQTDLILYSQKLADIFKKDSRIRDIDTSYRLGKPEVQIKINENKAKIYGVNTKTLGNEIRAQIAGNTPVKYRENGQEYNVRVRLLESQRDLSTNYDNIYIPNVNGRLIKLTDVADIYHQNSPAAIERQDRIRYVQVSASLIPGVGFGDVMTDLTKKMDQELILPKEVHLTYSGQSEQLKDMMQSIVFAVGMGILFIYLILASLYESFVIPFTIMLALPLAICGAFVALFITHQSINLLTMLGIIMLLGVACKNSILLVDYILKLMEEGKNRTEATIEACKIRLRPILMTSFALIAGMIPVAIGISALSAQRSSMGIAIIGGVISSTLLTLVVIPSAFYYIDRFRCWSADKLARMVGYEDDN